MQDTGPGLSLSLFWPLLVLALCAGALLLWRFLRLRATPNAEVPIRFMARVELSPQHVLYVVKAVDRTLLLGGAPGGLSLLTELPPSVSPSVSEVGHDAPLRATA